MIGNVMLGYIFPLLGRICSNVSFDLRCPSGDTEVLISQLEFMDVKPSKSGSNESQLEHIINDGQFESLPLSHTDLYII